MSDDYIDPSTKNSPTSSKMNDSNCHTTEHSAIMTPMDSLYCSNGDSDFNIVQNVNNGIFVAEEKFMSLNITSHGSFLFIDEDEKLKVNNLEEFVSQLGCNNDSKLKVVSIFGNSGDGKSYYLNNLLFKGDEVFKTSRRAEDRTRGVWAAWHGAKRLLCLDTPPLHLSKSSDILLMKILAISDVIIYRTRSERLPEDLFTFLGQASKAFKDNFKSVLHGLGHKIECGGPASAQGPAIFICHEPRHSFPLTIGGNGESPEDQIKAKFQSMGLNIDNFGSLFYMPTPPEYNVLDRTSQLPFNKLIDQLTSYLNNTAVRAARSPDFILTVLKALLTRFRGRLTCDVSCDACQAICSLSMGHEEEGIRHSSTEKCRYQHQFENKELICRECNLTVRLIDQSQEDLLSFARSAWYGYELHCPKCGLIYKSRQYWFGNQSEESVVYTKYVHVWAGQNSRSNPKVNVGVRRALEGVGNLVSTAYVYSTDYIAPSYWQPNSEITKCAVCECKLELGWGEIHHCRACGFGVCNQCSKTRAPVPHRGWNDPVRICDRCKHSSNLDDVEDSGNVTPRKVSEAVVTVLKPLTAALNYPKGVITELARPSYWIPDEEAPNCVICDILFGVDRHNARHHCRRCGQSVCYKCSPAKQSVPERGWGSPVRVCNKCAISESDMIKKET